MTIYADEPYVYYEIMFETDYHFESYEHEINGIEYSTFEWDGFYYAYWVYGEDYYTIKVADEAVLSEIIENLRKS